MHSVALRMVYQMICLDQKFLVCRFMFYSFLSDQEKVSCLLDKPGSVQYQFSGSPILHGMEYTPTEQCRLQAGTNTTEHCPGMKVRVCSRFISTIRFVMMMSDHVRVFVYVLKGERVEESGKKRGV